MVVEPATTMLPSDWMAAALAWSLVLLGKFVVTMPLMPKAVSNVPSRLKRPTEKAVVGPCETPATTTLERPDIVWRAKLFWCNGVVASLAAGDTKLLLI